MYFVIIIGPLKLMFLQNGVIGNSSSDGSVQLMGHPYITVLGRRHGFAALLQAVVCRSTTLLSEGDIRRVAVRCTEPIIRYCNYRARLAST